MGDSLSSLFRDNYRLHFSVDEWSEEVNQIFQQKRIEKSKVQTLLSQISCDAESTKQRIEALEKFISTLLLTYPFCMSYEEYFLPFAAKINRDQIFDEHALIQSQKTLIRELLQMPGKEIALSDDFVLEKKPYLEQYQMPMPQMGAKVAILWFLSARIKKSDEYKEKALAFAHFHASLLDYESSPFLALWTQEEDYHALEILASYYLLFYSAFHLHHEKKFQVYLLFLYQKMESIVKKGVQKAPIFLTLLSIWIDELRVPIVQYFEEKPSPVSTVYEPKYALIGNKSETMSSLISLKGIGTGMGCVHAGNVVIKTFGPQYFPLDGSSGFGVYRQIHETKDLKITETELSGWFRMCKTQKKEGFCSVMPEKNWMYAHSKVSNGHLQLEVLLHNKLETERIAFAFYLNAASCKIGEKVFVPRSLNRYVGALQPIQIETCNLHAQNAKEMHVIPLAGSGCFWDADFLIAYEMDEKPLMISIEA